MADSQTVDVLPAIRWILTVIGQIQVARKRRARFATWIVANAGLIGWCVRAGLCWSMGMSVMNITVCP